jgi:hypothetical protein
LLDPALARALVMRTEARGFGDSMAGGSLLHALQRLSLTGAAGSSLQARTNRQ